MKKSNRFLTGIIALSAIILFSCNNFAGGKVFEKGNTSVSSEKALLTVSIAEMFTSAQKNPYISENIMPTDWEEDEKAALFYMLTGSKEDGSDPIEKKFTYEELSGGTATILLDTTIWKLTLTAYTDGAYSKVALVSDLMTVDLSNGAKTISFALKADHTTDATGSVDVTVKFTKPSNFAKVVYGIYDDEGNLLAGSTEYTATVEGNDPAVALTEVTTGVYSANYTADIKAGKYTFKAVFYSVVNSVDKVICFYSDSIQIDAGNDTTKTIVLSEDVFNTPAAKPTTLRIDYSYNDPSYNSMQLAELTSATVNDKFNATFTWDDISDNETGFELIVKDAENNTVENVIKAGSLAASSETVTLELETGKVYTAKIRAINSFVTPVEADGDYTELEGNINLFTIAYNLNNGNIKKGENSSTANSITTYVIPYTKPNADISLISKETDPVAYTYVYRDNYTFIRWYEGADTATAVDTVSADNTANRVFTAYWQSQFGVTFTTPDYSEIADFAIVKDKNEAAVITVDGTTENTVILSPNDIL